MVVIEDKKIVRSGIVQHAQPRLSTFLHIHLDPPFRILDIQETRNAMSLIWLVDPGYARKLRVKQ
jgi:hypothetical protein